MKSVKNEIRDNTYTSIQTPVPIEVWESLYSRIIAFTYPVYISVHDSVHDSVYYSIYYD